MISRQVRKAGFTLIEMAMVLLIVALLLGGGLTVLSTQIEAQKFKDTQKSLEDAKDALIGYAASHAATDTRPHLPCPDKTTAAGIGTANDGLEDRAAAGGGCVVVAGEGNLPWVTLGLTGTDSWGNRFRYRVTPAFSNSVTGMTLAPVASAGTLNVINQLGAAQASAVPVVILSHGPNGWGATSTGGVVKAAPPVANVNEIENTDGDLIFVSSAPGEAGAAGGEFDDIVTWLPATLLFNRMLQATKLP